MILGETKDTTMAGIGSGNRDLMLFFLEVWFMALSKMPHARLGTIKLKKKQTKKPSRKKALSLGLAI